MNHLTKIEKLLEPFVNALQETFENEVNTVIETQKWEYKKRHPFVGKIVFGHGSFLILDTDDVSLNGLSGPNWTRFQLFKEKNEKSEDEYFEEFNEKDNAALNDEFIEFLDEVMNHHLAFCPDNIDFTLEKY